MIVHASESLLCCAIVIKLLHTNLCHRHSISFHIKLAVTVILRQLMNR